MSLMKGDALDRLRRALGLYFILYYLMLWKDLSLYFGREGMTPIWAVDNLYGLHIVNTFLVQSPVWVFHLIFSLQTVFFILFILDRMPRALFFVMLFTQYCLHQVNPYILHEPQAIHNFLLFAAYFGLRWNQDRQSRHRIALTLSVLLSFYYLLAGLKKLPDLNWITGHALQDILQTQLARANALTDWIVRHPFVCAVLQVFTLAFELFHWLAFFRPWRRIVFVAALVFHLGIFLVMDLGSLSFLMIAWNYVMPRRNESL